MHALYGGVVPEIASRKHVEAIAALTDKALADAGVTKAGHRRGGGHLRAGPDRRGAGGAELRQVRRLRAGRAAHSGAPHPRPHRRELSGLSGAGAAVPGAVPCPAATRCSWTCGTIPTLSSRRRDARRRGGRVLRQGRAGARACPIPAASRWTELAQQSAGGVYDLPRATMRGSPARHELFRPQDGGGQPRPQRPAEGRAARPPRRSHGTLPSAVSDELVPRAMLAARYVRTQNAGRRRRRGREHHHPRRPGWRHVRARA